MGQRKISSSAGATWGIKVFDPNNDGYWTWYQDPATSNDFTGGVLDTSLKAAELAQGDRTHHYVARLYG
jgi:hypothetical protein